MYCHVPGACDRCVHCNEPTEVTPAKFVASLPLGESELGGPQTPEPLDALHRVQYELLDHARVETHYTVCVCSPLSPRVDAQVSTGYPSNDLVVQR